MHYYQFLTAFISTSVNPYRLLFSLCVGALVLVPACHSPGQADESSLRPDVLTITVDDPVPTDRKVKATFSYTDVKGTTVYPGKMERRGGYSISFPKHSYEIDLKEDIMLGGLPADDDWILNANYIDKTFLRHVLSYELFAAMDPDNEAPRTRFVEVRLNGQYNGLYVLMEKLDRSSLGINKGDTAAVVFKEPHLFRSSYEGIRPKDSLNFHQQTFPKIKKADRRESVEALRQLLLSPEADDFRARLETAFDLDNLLDWHLLLLVTNNGDGILKNFYLYRTDAASPYRIAPWDYDHSFGRDGDNERNLDERPADLTRSLLFARLLKTDWYRTALRQRWDIHTESGTLNQDNLKKRIRTHAARIRPAALRNFDRWPVTDDRYFDINGFDEEIDLMLEFVDVRYARLTAYFDDL